MRRYKGIFIFLALTVLFLSGCRPLELNIEEKISPPTNITPTLQGTWKVVKYKTIRENEIDRAEEKYLNKKAAFSNTIAVFGEEICKEPEYKVKNVTAEDYFLYRYRISGSSLGVAQEKIDVVSITSNNQLFYDFIKINDNELIVYTNSVFLYFNKISNEVEDNIVEIDEKKETSSGIMPIREDSLLRSGILLGLRKIVQDEKGENTDISYRTLWIPSRNRELGTIKEMKQLFLPRKSGFWEIGYSKGVAGGKALGKLYANPAIDSYSEGDTSFERGLVEDIGRRKINFVLENYIGTEYEYVDEVSHKKSFKLQVLTIDNITSGRGVNISDILGEEGYNSLIRSSQSFLSYLDKNRVSVLEKLPKENNFTLNRRNGHWIMKGRLNTIKAEKDYDEEEFNVYLSTTKGLINFDELYIPWNVIKSKVPEALDAYTSPNKDIALIITANSIYVYAIDKGALMEKPIKKISIQEGESVIMAEWATGEYTEKWDEIVRRRVEEFSR
jgi:hypothetical protein